MYEKHLVFEEPAPDSKIWRYIDFTKFVNVLDKNALFFVRLDKLNDPYEGLPSKANENVEVRREIYKDDIKGYRDEEFVKKHLFQMGQEGKKMAQELKKTMAVNSWHLNDYESASMWNLYSQKYGLAVQTTFRRLCKSFDDDKDDKIFIGKVQYKDYHKDWVDEATIFSPVISKRKSFSSESELRAVVLMPDNHIAGRNAMSKEKLEQLNFLTDSGRYVLSNLNTLIERIYVHPLAESWLSNLIKDVMKKYDLEKEVIQSDLFSLE